MDVKRLVFGLIALVAVAAAVFLYKPKEEKKVLRVCTWSNYYPEAIIQDFTNKTGIAVEFSYISSNEELFAKFKAGSTGYDLIQPSDYMVRQMAKHGMLQELEHRFLTHLSHLDDFYRTLPYDPGLIYSVPFTWGTTGIAINTDKIAIPAEGVSWKMLFESKELGRVSLVDDMREVFGAVFMWQGLSLNTKEPKDLEMAKGLIHQIKNKILMFSSEPKPLLLKGEIDIGQVYSSDGIQAHRDNPKIKYFIPKEGATLWTDNFAIPASSKKAADAHAFINYFLDPQNAVKIAKENLLATPNKSAKAMLPKELTDDPNFYPSQEVMKKLSFMDDLGDSLSVMNRLWTELKSGG